MKQISARAFREVFRTLDAPVQVSTRGEGGYVRIIGTWTPLNVPEAIHASFGTSRPAPKPARGKR